MAESKKFLELMITICWRKIWDSIEFYKILERKRNWVSETILIVKIHKDGSVLESRIENAIPKLAPIFIRHISKSNSAKYYEVRLFLQKQTNSREEIDIMEEIEMDPKIHSIKQVS